MYKVIVVDDEALVREAICKKLDWEKIGYELAARFENGMKAKEYLLDNHVDVVLTDICMPYMDGMELSEFIYQNMPEVKVIIFSGFDEFEYAKKAIRFQVQEYLLKPVTAVELSELLTSLKEKIDHEREAKKKQAALSKVVNKNKIYLESRVLYKILCGSESVAECRRELEETGIVLEGQQFAAAVLSVGEKQSALFEFILYNMAEEIVKGREMGYTVMGEHGYIFILFCGKHQNSKVFKEKIRDCLCHISRVVGENTNATLDIGVGKVIYELEKLCLSWQTAVKSMDDIYFAGHGTILWAEEIGRKRNGEMDIRQEAEALTEAAKAVDGSGIVRSLDQIEEKLRAGIMEKAKAVVCLQMCVKFLYRCAEKYTEMSGGTEEIPLLVEEAVLFAVDGAASLEEAVEIIKKLAQQIAESCQFGIGGQQNKIAVKAMDYLHENFGRQELSLTEICTHFGVSVSRFSANFKSCYDETFMEALTRIRMDKAKALICRTDLKNYEIAERVGFTDPHYFSIAFKKATGKTPTEWGKEHVGA